MTRKVRQQPKTCRLCGVRFSWDHMPLGSDPTRHCHGSCPRPVPAPNGLTYRPYATQWHTEPAQCLDTSCGGCFAEYPQWHAYYDYGTAMVRLHGYHAEEEGRAAIAEMVRTGNYRGLELRAGALKLFDPNGRMAYVLDYRHPSLGSTLWTGHRTPA